MRNSSILRTAVLLTCLFASTAAFAGGPLILFAPNDPWNYPVGGVNVYTDLGGMGPLTNAQADVLSANGFAQWTGVASSFFNATVAGDFSSVGLPDITNANVATVIGVNNGGGFHVIYDTDGTITTGFLGAPPGVLGVASPDFGAGGILSESWAVMNGAAVNPGDPAGQSFGGVFTHEFGHGINMAHTQTNGQIVFFGNAITPAGCGGPYGGSPTFAQVETMYPFIDPSPGSVGVQMATIEHIDDVSTLSDIYPTGGWPAGTGTISGTIFNIDGTTPIGGVNVIARNVANAFTDAVSALSGDFTQSAADGAYTLTGLTPGANYVLYVDTIVDGGFSQTPVQPLPGPEEYYNAGESNTPVDDPCDFTTISVGAGATVTRDIQLNGANIPPTISVNPTSLSFTIPTNTNDNGLLTISNIAAAGADDLNWTIVDSDPVTTQIFPLPTDLPIGGGKAAVGRTITDDPTRMRCATCGKPRDTQPFDGDSGLAKMNLVNDGGFELGTGGPWIQSSTNFGTPLCDSTCGVAGANTGAWWCWFGGIAAFEDGAVRQSVVFPAGGTISLDFFVLPGACDSPADFVEVTIDGTQVWVLDGSSGLCGTATYSPVSVDLSAFADGAAHNVRFHSTIFANNAGGSNFFVDDVSITHTPTITDCAWLSAAPLAGTTAQGGSDNVTVTVDSTGLPVGVYNCSLQVNSDDPATPLVTVPVTLNVVASGVDVIVTTSTPLPVALKTLPSGSGDTFNAAQDWDGVVGSSPAAVDATVTVQLLQGGVPVVGHPANLMLVQVTSPGNWNGCNQNSPDGPTDVNGITTFSGALSAGGVTLPGAFMEVAVGGLTINSITYNGGATPLDIRVMSPDIDANFTVNLADLGFFATDFAGAYAFRSDFQWNGVLNLADVGVFATDFGDACTTIVPGNPTASGDMIGVYFDTAGRNHATDLEPGKAVTAYLMLQGPSASKGIDAWDAQLVTSSNLVVRNVVLPQGSINVGSDHEFVVGTGGMVVPKGKPAVLATLTLEVTDNNPASLSLTSSSLAQGASPIVARGEELQSVALSMGEGMPVAYVNDEHAPRNDGLPVPATLSLSNVPNPFNPSTEIRFNLPRDGRAEVRIYDVSGRLVSQLDGGLMTAGASALTWNGVDHRGAGVRSGLYFYQLLLDGQSLGDTKKMNLVK